MRQEVALFEYVMEFRLPQHHSGYQYVDLLLVRELIVIYIEISTQITIRAKR